MPPLGAISDGDCRGGSRGQQRKLWVIGRPTHILSSRFGSASIESLYESPRMRSTSPVGNARGLHVGGRARGIERPGQRWSIQGPKHTYIGVGGCESTHARSTCQNCLTIHRCSERACNPFGDGGQGASRSP